MAAESGLGHRLLRLLEWIHLTTWIVGLLASGLAAMVTWRAGLGRAWIVGSAVVFVFCLAMVAVNIVIRRFERYQAEIQTWRDRCAAVEAKLADAVTSAELVRAMTAAEAERRGVAIGIVSLYKKIRDSPSEDERKRLLYTMDQLRHVFYARLSEEQRDYRHKLYEACGQIATVCGEKQPIADLEKPVRAIASFFGLEGLV